LFQGAPRDLEQGTNEVSAAIPPGVRSASGGIAAAKPRRVSTYEPYDWTS